MTIGASMAGGNPQDGRVDDDFYQTEVAATHAMLRFLKRHWQPHGPLLVWEPACGKGAMSEVMLEYKTLIGGVISTDLVDRGYGHGGIDFLQVDQLPRTSRGVYNTIITNQPFNLSYDFFMHAVKLGAERIVFLMKAQYWHTNWQKAPFTSKQMWHGWSPSWWLPNCWRLQFKSPEELALMDKKPSSTMDTAWCVWDRHATHQGCLMVPLQKPIGFDEGEN